MASVRGRGGRISSPALQRAEAGGRAGRLATGRRLFLRPHSWRQRLVTATVETFFRDTNSQLLLRPWSRHLLLARGGCWRHAVTPRGRCWWERGLCRASTSPSCGGVTGRGSDQPVTPAVVRAIPGLHVTRHSPPSSPATCTRERVSQSPRRRPAPGRGRRSHRNLGGSLRLCRFGLKSADSRASNATGAESHGSAACVGNTCPFPGTRVKHLETVCHDSVRTKLTLLRAHSGHQGRAWCASAPYPMPRPLPALVVQWTCAVAGGTFKIRD